MAKKNEDAQEQQASGGKASLPLIPLVLTVVVAVVAAVGLCAGAGFWLIRSGRIAGLGQPGTVQAAAKPLPAPSHAVALGPLLVNLADEDGHAYLRVGLTLQVEDKPLAKGEKPAEEAPAKGTPVNEFEAAERDAALAVLGRQTSSKLLGADGKEQLKQQLRDVLAERVPEVKVKEILFTEFLVQH